MATFVQKCWRINSALPFAFSIGGYINGFVKLDARQSRIFKNNLGITVCDTQKLRKKNEKKYYPISKIKSDLDSDHALGILAEILF